MSHTKSDRQLENLGRNRRSVWIERAGDGYEVTAKHGIRVIATATAGAHEEALEIAAAMKAEHRAGEIVDRSNS